MNELDRIMEIIEAAGFSHTGKISMDTVELRDEVRDMCHNGNCGKYARNGPALPAAELLISAGSSFSAIRPEFLCRLLEK